MITTVPFKLAVASSTIFHAIHHAARLASMMLSLTPTVPHSSLPSVDSINTRVCARAGRRIQDAHLVIRELDFLHLRIKTRINAARNAESNAFTGPSPSATVCAASPFTRTLMWPDKPKWSGPAASRRDNLPL